MVCVSVHLLDIGNDFIFSPSTSCLSLAPSPLVSEPLPFHRVALLLSDPFRGPDKCCNLSQNSRGKTHFCVFSLRSPLLCDGNGFEFTSLKLLLQLFLLGSPIAP